MRIKSREYFHFYGELEQLHLESAQESKAVTVRKSHEKVMFSHFKEVAI